MNVQLPTAASLQRTDDVAKKIEAILKETPGVQTYNTVVGFSLLSIASMTYNALYFVTLKPWDERDAGRLTAAGDHADASIKRLAELPEAQAFAFSPPAIPGIGTVRRRNVHARRPLRPGSRFSRRRTCDRFLQAARQRPEFATLTTTFIPSVPQVYADVDRDKVLKQGVDLRLVYQDATSVHGRILRQLLQPLRPRRGRSTSQAEGEFRTQADNVGLFRVRNSDGDTVPLSTLVTMKTTSGPEFTNRFNGYRAAQINGQSRPGYSSAQARQALEEVFAQTMPREMGYDYQGMSFQEQVRRAGRFRDDDLRFFAAVCFSDPCGPV